MAKNKMSPEEKAAFAARMKAAREAKKVNQLEPGTAYDKRGHLVKMYQDGELWFVERNHNGAVHPEQCADESEAKKLFDHYCTLD